MHALQCHKCSNNLDLDLVCRDKMHPDGMMATLDGNTVRIQFKDKAREKQRQRALKQQQQQQQQQARQQGAPPGPTPSHIQDKRRAVMAEKRRAEAAAAAAAAAEERRLPAAKRRMFEMRQDNDELRDDYRLLKKLKKGRVSEVRRMLCQARQAG